MQRWEYQMLQGPPMTILTELNQLGAQGWEVIAVLPVQVPTGEQIFVTLKRPKQP